MHYNIAAISVVHQVLFRRFYIAKESAIILDTKYDKRLLRNVVISAFGYNSICIPN